MYFSRAWTGSLLKIPDAQKVSQVDGDPWLELEELVQRPNEVARLPSMLEVQNR